MTRIATPVRSASRSLSSGLPAAVLERFELERLLSREMILADQLRDSADEVFVLQHQQLGVEDPGLVDTSTILGAGTELGELAAHVLERGTQPPHLLFDLGARHDAVRNLRQGPAHRHGRPHRDAGRDADALQQPITRRHASSFSLAFRCIS